MAKKEETGDLLAPPGSSPARQPVNLGIQASAGDGGYVLLFRLPGGILAELLGMPAVDGLTAMARHVDVVLRPSEGGLSVSLSLNRPKLGIPLIRPVGDVGGDWLIGPCPLNGLLPRLGEMLGQYDEQNLLPLTWSGIRAERAVNILLLPDIFSLRAIIGDQDAILLPGSQPAPAGRSRPRRGKRPASLQTSLVLPLAGAMQRHQQAARPVEVIATPMLEARRRRNATLRLSVGMDGRIGLTLPQRAAMILWGEQGNEDGRLFCWFGRSGPDGMLLRDGDALIEQIQATSLVLKMSSGAWYGRSTLRDQRARRLIGFLGCEPGTGIALRDGREFQSEDAGGRIRLRNLFASAAPMHDPQMAEKLGRASDMMTAAFGLMRSIRQEFGTANLPDIEIVDESGLRLSSIPERAAAARIRSEAT